MRLPRWRLLALQQTLKRPRQTRGPPPPLMLIWLPWYSVTSTPASSRRALVRGFLGHPLGMSGARLVTTAAYQLRRTNGRYALCTMCIGVGQGIAMIIERA